jgi:hypothetical protein
MTDFDHIIGELEEAIAHSNDENGEVWETLLTLWQMRDYLYDDFRDCLEDEIRRQHLFMKENYTLVEHDAFYCNKCVRGHIKKLVHNDDL